MSEVNITPYIKAGQQVPAPGKERTHVITETIFTCPECGNVIHSSWYINYGYFQMACKEHLEKHKKEAMSHG